MKFVRWYRRSETTCIYTHTILTFQHPNKKFVMAGHDEFFC